MASAALKNDLYVTGSASEYSSASPYQKDDRT